MTAIVLPTGDFLTGGFAGDDLLATPAVLARTDGHWSFDGEFQARRPRRRPFRHDRFRAVRPAPHRPAGRRSRGGRSARRRPGAGFLRGRGAARPTTVASEPSFRRTPLAWPASSRRSLSRRLSWCPPFGRARTRRAPRLVVSAPRPWPAAPDLPRAVFVFAGRVGSAFVRPLTTALDRPATARAGFAVNDLAPPDFRRTAFTAPFACPPSLLPRPLAGV